MKTENKYVKLFSEYTARIREEKLSEGNVCSLSVRESDTLFAYLPKQEYKEIAPSDIRMLGLVSTSEDSDAELVRLIYLENPEINAVLRVFPLNCATVGKARINIPPLLDDMAQIIGPDGRYSENNSAAILKVLKKRNACLIVDNGVIAMGRSLDEAYVSALVLEKAAKCFIDVTVLGSFKKINGFETRLMHFVYQKKYSKQNQANKNKELEGGVSTKVQEDASMSPREKELRQMIKDAGVRLVNSNLVQGTWGNISMRLDDKYMLITPTALDYLSLTPADMVKVNLETMEYEGLHKPSGERDIHAEMLRTRPEVNVVMHSHPPECSAFAAANQPLPAITPEMEKYVGGDAKVGKYALPSTKGLSKATVAAMEGRNACFMANHGMLAVGVSVDETFETCRVMEESARAYIDKKASELSNAKTPEDRRRDIFTRKH
jgi:L-ribulose-5-phosphate 4-epimerase